MAHPGEGLPAAVCDDRPTVAASVSALLRRAGFEPVASTRSWPALEAAVRASSPCVAVVALPLTGMAGLAALRTLRSAAPGCELVVLEAPGRLAQAVLEAGARTAVPDDDLRGLRDVLLAIAAERRTAMLPAARPHSDGSAAPVTGRVSRKPSS
jgi:DNA-binding NarL/FixJ family response regulator